MRIGAVRPVAQKIRTGRDAYVPALHQTVHGRLDLGRGPHRPLLHSCHPAGRQTRFLLPLLLRLSGILTSPQMLLSQSTAYGWLMLTGILVSLGMWLRL